jgi:16S rRNA (guanine527-N7)-methyltransferase
LDVESFVREAAGIGLNLSPPQVAAFAAFEEALYAANETMNLTRVPREDCWRRHFLDSLLIHDLVLGPTILDIGTGPGFPAWPLALARPGLEITALDSNGKMIAYLSDHALPNLLPIQCRAEELDGLYATVTGRAFAPLSIQLEVSARLCKRGGIVLPMRTPGDEAEIRRLDGQFGLTLEEIHTRSLPGSGEVRALPVYRRTGRLSRRRTWAEMKRKPV